MTAPELDNLILETKTRVACRQTTPWDIAAQLVDELDNYRKMALRLERCVHELVKAVEQLEAEDIDNQINLRMKAEQELAELKLKVGIE